MSLGFGNSNAQREHLLAAREMPHAVRGCDEVCAIRHAQVYARLGIHRAGPVENRNDRAAVCESDQLCGFFNGIVVSNL